MIEIITQILLYMSSISMLIGAIGMLRFPDFYTRVHAATMVTIGGVCFSLLLIAASTFWSIYTLKTVIIVIFMLFTSPVIAHALANTAYELGIKPKNLSKNIIGIKKLKEVMEKEYDI